MEKIQTEKIKCKKCNKDIDPDGFLTGLNVCPNCGYHHYIGARERIQITFDEGSFNEMAQDLNSVDFLDFYDLKSYEVRLKEARLKSGLNEAVIVGNARIDGFPTSLGVMDFNFMGGSMGSVVGEKIKIIADYSITNKLPLIMICASGGARMQEGIMSLMQMAKTVSCINRLRENKVPYICLITNPTTGGVSASFATVADIIISEPGTLFCFAGPRVVGQTIKKAVPPDFGSAERNLKNGQLDMIVERKDVKGILARLLKLFKN
jgi:acetyl-CoA carboxylase carboxyl transferase subunit beta